MHDQNLRPAAGRGTSAVDLFVLSRLTITIRDYLGSLDPDFGHLYINHFDSL